jgi:DNA-binding IclR family transcriptional regulator
MAQPASVKSADRALELLELFDAYRDGLTLTDVCGITGWPKSSSLGLLRTLEHRQFLDTSHPDGKYRLGPRIASLGLAWVGGLDIAREGADVVRDVARACDETVHLAILKGTDVLYVAKEEGGGHMRMVSMVGRMVPAHGTGVGKVLLAALPPEGLDRRYPPGHDLPALTARPVTDRAEFLLRLATIRQQGYATDFGESTVGLCCFAGPVRDYTGETVAAMSVSVPEPRFTAARRPELFEQLMDGVRTLSLRMGCPPDRLPQARYRGEGEVIDGPR